MSSENTSPDGDLDPAAASSPAHQPVAPQEGGYGSPMPEDEMPANAGSGPGSDGEPEAGRLGGADNQLREELARSQDSPTPQDRSNRTDEDPTVPEGTEADLPSAEAPMNPDNAGPTREDRESSSSEPGEESASQGS